MKTYQLFINNTTKHDLEINADYFTISTQGVLTFVRNAPNYQPSEAIAAFGPDNWKSVQEKG